MASDQREKKSYASQWAAYRRRRILARTFIYGLVPVLALSLTSAGGTLSSEVPAIVLAFGWLAGVVVSIWWAGEFRCPRCSRRYGALGSKGLLASVTRGVFDDICPNCKLRKFAESD